MDQEVREQRTALPGADVDGPAISNDFEWAEQAKLCRKPTLYR